MGRHLWTLEGQFARLHLAGLAATIDCSRPASGLGQLCVDREPVGGACLLAFDSAWESLGAIVPGADHCCRSDELMVGGAPGPDRPAGIDARWRGVPPEGPGEFGAIELILSLWTELWEVQPDLRVRSRLPVAEVLRLVDMGSSRFDAWPWPDGPPRAAGVEQGPDCLLFRLDGGRFSYAEMVHPADCQGSELVAAGRSPPAVEVRHRMRVGRLEKGVLLRTRVRGAFLRREGDTRLVSALYAAFAAADPPLDA
jgi:hypothetical protein